VKVTVPLTEEVREAYLEVKEAATKAVITTLKFLSPLTKQGRTTEIRSRQRVEKPDSSRRNRSFRAGDPLPVVEDLPQSYYRILVSRSAERPTADLYLFNLILFRLFPAAAIK